MVKKAITDLDSLKAPCLEYIPVVVLKNREPELSYILADIFNICLNESCFSGCWKVPSLVPVFRKIWERSKAAKYRPVSFTMVG